VTNVTMLCANRPRLLKQALDSIGDLSNATVTIRDAGMNKEVDRLAIRWCQLDVTRRELFSSSRKLGTGPARNQVVASSAETFGRGDYLYLSDDDVCWTDPNWLAKLIDVYENMWSTGYRVLGAYCHPFSQPVTWHGSVYEVYALTSQSMLMRWSVWDEFGPFCDTPAGKVCQSEDVDFSNRIRAAGFKVGVISPALLVNTGITNSFGEKIPGWELVKSQCPESVWCE